MKREEVMAIDLLVASCTLSAWNTEVKV